MPVDTVYPRWRGEHSLNSAISVSRLGLSPLARGTHALCVDTLCRNRFIPAGAGNTQLTALSGWRRPVYPRWRGEHELDNVDENILVGLSPLARGTHIDPTVCRTGGRFIPAGAGNTILPPLDFPLLPVYPRWRGEHIPTVVFKREDRGLSPLARGTRDHGMNWELMSRFIPAGAGNTKYIRRRPPRAPVYPRWRGEHTKRISLFINYFLSAPHSTNIIATI